MVHTLSSESPGTSVATVWLYANYERVRVGRTRPWVGSQKDGPISQAQRCLNLRRES